MSRGLAVGVVLLSVSSSCRAPQPAVRPIGIRTELWNAAGLVELTNKSFVDDLKEYTRGLLRSIGDKDKECFAVPDGETKSFGDPEAIVVIDFRPGSAEAPFLMSLRLYDVAYPEAFPSSAVPFHQLPLIFSDFERIDGPGVPDPNKCKAALRSLAASMVDDPKVRAYVARSSSFGQAGRAVEASFYWPIGLQLSGDSRDPQWIQENVLFPEVPAPDSSDDQRIEQPEEAEELPR